MLRLEPIDEIVKLSLFSAYIAEEEQPVSLLLYCDAEAGKTMEVIKARGTDGIIIPSDMTAFGILTYYGDDILTKKIRHILIPDLIAPLSKRWETSASFITFLNSLIEEGILEVRTFAMSKKFRKPIKCGIIACVTPEALSDRRHRWGGMGFMSRLLPVSWSYTNITRKDILDFICSRQYRQDTAWMLTLPTEDIDILLPVELAKAIQYLTLLFADATRTYGFRYQKHLQRLMMASALADGRFEVNKDDFDKVCFLAQYLNLNRTAI